MVSVFKHCNNTTERGSVGETRAIYEFVSLGWVVSKPVNDKAKYDLIVDDHHTLRKVQVKTSTKKTRSGGFEVRMETSYANRNISVRKTRNETDYDVLFVLVETGDAWLIPVEQLNGAQSCIVVGCKKWDEYKL